MTSQPSATGALGSSATPANGGSAAWASRRWRAMGSTADLLVWGPDAEALADRAIVDAERLESCWTRFDPTSELCRLNASAGDGPTAVSDTLADALRRAREGWVDSGGAFDPTVGPALVALGYDRTFRAVPGDGPAVADRLPVPGFGVVAFGPAAGTGGALTVALPAGVALDLGGIGKGLAADRLAEGLRRRGAQSVCVSVGGDLRVSGPGPDADATWLIPVLDPDDGQTRFQVPLRSDEALAQSTTRLRRWRRGGRHLHHLIDPRTGQPTDSDVETAVVRDTSAWRAEVLAKATVVLGRGRGLALLDRAGATGWLIDRDGALWSNAEG